jgi:PPOX class probable F420-dependent enzyme
MICYPPATAEVTMLLNPDNPAHLKAAGRLRDESGIWLTTVTPSGQPQSSLVWFLWDGEEFLIYGSKKGQKTPNIIAHPQVSLHLDSNGLGGGVVTFEGTARIDPEGPPPGDVAAYMAKYGDRIASNGWNAETFGRDYPHVIKVTPARARIW